MRLTPIAASVFCLPLFLPAKAPITHEDVWLMKRVDAPAPSPDGKWVVFSVAEPSYSATSASSDLWIVPADGSRPARRLTNTKGPESTPAWSPDSKRIAFSASREGDDVTQIYVLDISEPGEAVRITSLSTAAANPVFSPDGRMVLYQSSVYPGAPDDDANRKIAAERKTRKYNARVYESFPVRYWDHWLDETQRHLFVQTTQPGSPARDLLAGTKLVAAAGFAAPFTSAAQDLYAAWAPDGKSIVFTATDARNQSAFAQVNTNLYQVAIDGGEPKRITTGDHNFAKPKFRPDGKALYCEYEPHTSSIFSQDRLAKFEWPAMSGPKIITAAFDRGIGSYAFTPDSKSVYLTAEDAGLEKLYKVASDGGEVREVGRMAAGAYSNLAIPSSASAPILLANYDSATNPLEIVSIDATTGERKLLTDFNVARAANIDLPPARHFWFTSTRGKKIHSMIVLPPAFDESKKYPLFVVMHGGPHSMWRDQWVTRWNYHLLASPGYVVLLTDYTGSTGYGEKFAQEVQGDPLAGPGSEINEAADYAIKQYSFIDGTRQAAAGGSYGGHLANWMQASTSRYKCLIAHAGLINLESQWGTSDGIYHRELTMGGPVWEGGKLWNEQNPIRFAKKFHTPILLTVGEQDFRVPLNQTLENWSVLQRLKIPSKLIVFPDANHWISRGEDSRFWYSEVHKWLAKYLQPGLQTSGVRSSGLQ
jgi:dipeptidyl aminopeptidase/acylaminoacyl peptidase